MNDLEFEYHEKVLQDGVKARKLAEKHAKDVLIMAHLGCMPATYWHTDNRILAACETLGWTSEYAMNWFKWEDEEE